MLSKFSVKKPYTVVVGIVLALILGFIAITRMSTDLLPSMNMPYALVITTAVGMTPEEVEKQVSAPIEASMATVTDIKNVSSTSQDNYSMVVLEFGQNANMDSITVEMRESLDTLSASWDESVGNPIIMKINPDMMPVLISAVSIEGMEGEELTNYIENEVIPELESVAGVASVTMSGGIDTHIEVKLNAEKIDALNAKVKKSLDKQFANAEYEIKKAQNAIDSQSSKLEDGENQLISATTAAVNQLTDQKVQLIQTKTELQGMILENQMKLQDPTISSDPMQVAMLNATITALEGKVAEIDKGIDTINENIAMLNAQQISGAATMGSANAQIASGKSEIDKALSTLKNTKEDTYAATDLSSILSEDTLKGILIAQNFDMPAGYVEQDGESYLVRVGDDLTDIDALSNVVLMDMGMDDVGVIRLCDVADVYYVDNAEEVYTSLNGVPGIVLTIEKQTGYSTGDVTNAVMDRLASMEDDIKGLESTVLMDQGVYIKLIVDSVMNNMIYGGILAIIILMIFLKDIRPTAVIAVSIPVSVIVAIVLMYFSDVTLNIISLSGLALGIGMLVDNSIVVIENIYRLRALGLPAKEAAVKGAKQVAGAIVASTLTTVSVFLPIVFTDGITRQLFVDMGLTIGYSLLASLLIALTFVPMMASGALANYKEKKHGILDKIQELYAKSLEPVLKFKPVVFIVCIAMLVGSYFAAASRGTAFLPEMDSTQMTVIVTPKEGSTMAETTQLSDEIIEKILTVEDVETVGAMLGGSSMLGGGSSSDVTMYVIVNEDKKLTNWEIADEIKELTKDMDCEIEVQASSMDLSSLMTSGISVKIKGRDLEKLQAIEAQVRAIVEETEGTIDVTGSSDTAVHGVKITVDKEKAAGYGMTVAQIYQIVAVEMMSDSAATTISTDVTDYEVYLASDEETAVNKDEIGDITFTYTDKESGEEKDIPIKEVATIEDTTSLSTIRRDSSTRYVTVSATIADGHNVGLVSDDIKEGLDKLEIPEGYEVEMSGEDETINEAMEQLILMMIVGVAFIYLIMVAQFQSLLSPFIILFTIPLAFTGGLLGLFFTGSEISVIAMIGFVMLAGVIVNNGIVLVDYINQLRMTGMTKHDAIIQSARERLRPILMTALTTILAMSTMAMGVGMGADLSQPMAIVTIGGLTYGTFLTLYVVPCIYDVFNKEKSMVVEEIDDDISDL